MKNKYMLPLLLIAGLGLTACEKREGLFENSVRSGTVSNDYVEEPLSKNAQKYEKALATSNRFLDLWQKKDFQTIHDELIDPDLRNKDGSEILSVEKLASIHKNVENVYGSMLRYKKMQWAFEPKSAKKQYILFSIKTVEHKDKKVNYFIQFLLDGGFEKIIGFYVRERPILRMPGQVHNNTF